MYEMIFTSLLYLLVSSVSAQGSCRDAVINLKAQSITNTSAHLSWDPPASTECADRYKLMYCSYLDDEWHQCAFKTVFLPLNSTQYDITKLEPCRQNLVRLYTVGTNGSEIPSELIFYTGGGDPPKLDKVDLIYAGVTNITVSWDRPKNYNDQCYPGYRVCYSAKGDSQETCSYSLNEEFDTTSLPPLSPCTEYDFSVVTVDGNFAADSKTSEKTYASVFTAPQMPNVTVDVQNHTAHLTWKALDPLSLTCAANYLVKDCRLKDQMDPVVCEEESSETLPLNATEASISDLVPCTNNHVSVSLVGHNGYSSSTTLVVFDKDGDIPLPSSVAVADVSTSGFRVNYYKGRNDCVTAYRACWFSEGEEETCRRTGRTHTGTFSDLHLKPCTNYTLHFTALGKGGRSSKNFTTTFLTGPDSALNLTVEPSVNSALMTWRQVPSALVCGSSYSISWQEYYSEGPLIRAVVPLNATSYNITGLTSCTDYQFRFITNGTNGTASGKNEDIFTTTAGDTEPITNFSLSYSDDFYSMDVDFPDSWVDCMDTFSTCLYETGGPQEEEQCQQDTMEWDRNLLKSCFNYTVVVSVPLGGSKNVSSSTTFTTGPGKVSNVRLEEDASARTVNLSWTNPPTNSLCVQYIQVTTTRVQDHEVTQVKLPSDTTTTTATGLSPCTTYLFEVQPVASSVDSGNNYLAQYTTYCGDAVSSP